MADLLEQLQRPSEAIAWRAIALKSYGGTDSQWAALQKKYETMHAEGWTEQPPKKFLTCGIDVAEWPLPSADEIANLVAIESRPTSSHSSAAAPIVLRDVAAKVGLVFQYDNGDDPNDYEYLLHQMTGGGIGVIDFDLDGCSDLYFTQGGGDGFAASGSLPNRLFRNLAGQRFFDVTSQTGSGDQGYGQGVAVADINQDGFPDLLVANIGPNLMYLNNGDGTFTRSPLPLSSPDGAWTTSIACGDLSGDHLPEILEVNYIDDPSAFTIFCTADSDRCNPRSFQPAADHVWRVHPDMRISPFNGCQDIDARPSYGFGTVIANFDGKAGNEWFIANDGKHNHYWVGQDDGDPVKRMLLESSRVYGCDAGLLW